MLNCFSSIKTLKIAKIFSSLLFSLSLSREIHNFELSFVTFLRLSECKRLCVHLQKVQNIFLRTKFGRARGILGIDLSSKKSFTYEPKTYKLNHRSSTQQSSVSEIIRFQFETLKESPQAECNKLMKASDRFRPSEALMSKDALNPIAQFNHYLQMFNEPQDFEVFHITIFSKV